MWKECGIGIQTKDPGMKTGIHKKDGKIRKEWEYMRRMGKNEKSRKIREG